MITLAVAAAVATSSTVTYTSMAEVVVKPRPTSGAPIEPQMGTERAIAQSGAVAERAAESLGEMPAAAAAGLSVSVELDTTVLDIEYVADTAQGALQGARAFTYAYLDFRNGDGSVRVAEVVTAPGLPAHGAGANLVLILGLGAMLGLALGVGAAWVWDRVADRVRDAGELEEQTGVPVLGELPSWARHESRVVGRAGPANRRHPHRGPRLAPLASPGPGEAFGYVVAGLLAQAGSRRHGITVVVTSPRPAAGTTTVAVNTARTLAAQGRDVVLVGADLHDPRLHECLEVAASPGLLDVLNSDCTVERALQRTGDPHLRVLSAGVTPDANLHLHVDNLQLLLAQLGSSALVVVDAPPLLTWPESLVLADKADLVVLVADLRCGTRKDAAASVTLLQGLQPRIAGWVVNRPPRRSRRTPPRRAAVDPTLPALAQEPGLRANTSLRS
jgi:Mrp family chromosome partitioning ATPase/capsular polysaccharide biosynthesis protein